MKRKGAYLYLYIFPGTTIVNASNIVDFSCFDVWLIASADGRWLSIKRLLIDLSAGNHWSLTSSSSRKAAVRRSAAANPPYLLPFKVIFRLGSIDPCLGQKDCELFPSEILSYIPVLFALVVSVFALLVGGFRREEKPSWLDAGVLVWWASCLSCVIDFEVFRRLSFFPRVRSLRSRAHDLEVFMID